MTNITGPATIERVKKIRDYAFVHFNTRENAAKAKKAVNGMNIDGSVVEITWAKPVDREAYAKYNKNANRNYDNGGVSQNFDHLKSLGLAPQMTSNFVYLQPNLNANIDGSGAVLQGHNGVGGVLPVLMGSNGRVMQAVNPQVILASPNNLLQQNHHHHASLVQNQINPGNYDSRTGNYSSRSRNDDNYNRNQNGAVNQNNRNNFGYRQPYQNNRNQGLGYNNMQTMIRSKPRGAGGIRAVGSRQYLNNKDSSGISGLGNQVNAGLPSTNSLFQTNHRQQASQSSVQTSGYFNNYQETDTSSYILSDRPDSTEHMSTTTGTIGNSSNLTNSGSLTGNISSPSNNGNAAVGTLSSTSQTAASASAISPPAAVTNNQTIFSQPLYPASYISAIQPQMVTSSSASMPVTQQQINQQVPLMYALINPEQQGGQTQAAAAAQNYSQLNQQYMLIQGQQTQPANNIEPVVTASSSNFDE